ncbi:MAG TPA: SPOR domain-containing protein [Sphingomonas sp.]|nr:SPOR domain-containing protein [Sphingomonas sp.]
MSDLGRSVGGTADEDRLPWLEPVEEERRDEGVSAARLIAGLVVALVALGLVIGGVYWLKQRAGGPGTAAGDPTLIAAQPGAYKVKPTEPGGMDVKGQGDSSYATSEGADPNAKIDLSAVPEAPIGKDGKPVAAAPTPAPAAQPAPAKPTPVVKATPAPAPAPVVAKPTPVAAKPAPVAVKPAPAKVEAPKAEQSKPEASTAPASGGTQVQLGAFSSEAKANEAWKSLSGRFGYLAALSKSVVPVTSNGKTIYRLRASAGGQAASICSKLKVAGEACVVIG